ncbi:FkbM family methyltransferase [Salegentibacter sediminis]|uniref:FkbM family methyltransferase n=1 Tax=Salegentibacter sediminis TaxID=1930251 RepID=UPI0009BF301F|nr:FkbM family methyltransferase [Salegentibacter sediminis]
MKKIKNYLTAKFLNTYTKLPNKAKRFICFNLRWAYKPGSVLKKLRFRGKFRVRLPNNNHFYMINYGSMIENETFWEGAFKTFENDVGWLWIELCRCSDVIFDIGANTGIYSLVAKSINPASSVYAFEPSIHTFKRLELNNKINSFDIHCEEKAVSNYTGNQLFYDLPYPNDNASLSPDKMKNWSGYKGSMMEYEVETVQLSSYIKNQNIPGIDLIKFDIEMHEPEAIKGLENYLLKYKPIMFIEVLSVGVANRLNELFNLNDYKLFHLQKGNKIEKLSEFKMCREYLNNWEWNFLLFHKDLEEKVKRCTSIYEKI